MTMSPSKIPTPWRIAIIIGATALLLVIMRPWSASISPVTKTGPAEHARCQLPAQNDGDPHPEMVWVPSGSFDLGDTVYPEEGPVRHNTVAGFWMDRTEVTNDEFAAFVAATGYVTVAERAVDLKLHPGLPPEMQKPGAVVFVMPKNAASLNGDITQWWRYVPGANWRHPGGPDTSIDGRGSFPVVTITFEDAQAYAKWRGRALPTEAQWEWAARAGTAQAAQDHEQPQQANTWQGLFPMMNSADDGFVGLAPVGCYAPNALGLFDMIGNVWELTADAFTETHTAPDGVLPDIRPAATARHVIKGGSFLCAPDYCMRYRSGSRQPQDDDLGASHLGFRTVLNATGP
jgi:formylglycine-generating enzyme required for sulfatase activity